MSVLILFAVAILIVLIVVAHLIGKCFKNPRTRKQIMIGTVVVYCLVCVAYFGFIAFVLSGDINR
jgi:drug/metabolite transporter (DMT)-like permease